MMYTRTRLSRMVLLSAVCATLVHALFAQSQTPPVRAVSPCPYAVTVESHSTLATHTAYHPTDLTAWGSSKRLMPGQPK